MKKFIFSFLITITAITTFAQESAGQLQENARKFMAQGDYSNAILILNKAHKLSPNDLEITKDLALNYYYQKESAKGLEIIKPTLDDESADDQCYQIAGNIYQALGMTDDCDKLYKKALKKFPSSGALYNDYGELLAWTKQPDIAIKQWEKGIEEDPGASKNYYNASRYYYAAGDYVWSILYGETFLNIEPLSSNSPEIKNMLLESYKVLFTNLYTNGNASGKNDSKFVSAYKEILNKQSNIAGNGIDVETITMIRTRFILDWYNTYATKFPFRLFDLQQQLLQNGMFDAYNQWIFGTAQNLSAYQNWTISHAKEYTDFNYFQRGRIFKLPKGQYYK